MHYLKTVLLFLCLAISVSAWSDNDSLRIVQLEAEATSLLKEGSAVAAREKLAQALALAKEQDRLIDFIATIKSFTSFQRTEIWDPAGSLKDFEWIQSLWREPNSQEEWDALAWLHVNHGYMLAQGLGRFADAVAPYTRAVKIFRDNPAWEDELVAHYIYQVLGNIQTRLGDYPAAAALLKSCLPILENSDRPDWAVDIYSDLGILYKSWNKPKEALAYLEEARKYPGLGHVQLGLIKGNIALVQEVLGKQKDARLTLDEAIAHWMAESRSEEPYHQTDFHLANCYAQRAALLQEGKDTDTALKNMEEALSLMSAYFGNAHRREIGKLELQKGYLLLDANRAKEALLAFQDALKHSIYNFEPSDAYICPKENQLRAENTISEALLGKAKAHTKLAEEGDLQKELEMALRNYELASLADQILWKRFLYDDAKLLTLEESHSRTEEAIQIALKLASLQVDKGFAERAFQLAENSRGLLLLEAFRQAELSKTTTADPQMQARERRLREALADAEAFRYEIEGTSPSDSLLNAAETAVLTAHQTYRNWRDSLAQTDPGLRQIGYAEASNSMQDLQSMLGKGRAMISYFPTEAHLFTFYLDEQGLRVFELEEADQLVDRVTQMRLDIERFQFSGSDRAALCQTYTDVSHKLYQQLIASIEAKVQMPERLLIIPGGVLHYLPFEALLTAIPKKSCDFSSYPYLLHDYEISLGYSANLQYDLYQTALGQAAFAGFAPDFSKSDDWTSLVCSKDRLQSIAQKLGGQYFGSGHATASLFQEEAGQYGILQLGTHAQANTDDADFGFIVFDGEEKGSFDSLFVNDIYTLNLDAELVALSACETAVGKLYAGEGVISLGRGFLYAGARSIMSTLWRINESANCDLLAVFYDELDQGVSKSQALRKAKQSYLESADRQYAHPAYWAAFQLVGNERPLKKGKLVIWPFALVGVLLSSGLLFWYKPGTN